MHHASGILPLHRRVHKKTLIPANLFFAGTRVIIHSCGATRLGAAILFFCPFFFMKTIQN